MLVSDQIAEACKSAIYFGMLNQSLFSCFVLVFEFLSVPFPELILGLEISGLGTSFWKGCVCVCVCVHACTHECTCAYIYTWLCQTALSNSWEAKLSTWPGTTHAWSLPTYWACLTYRPHIPSRDAPDKQVWAHQSCLVSSASWSSPLLQQPVGTFKAAGYFTQNARLPDSLGPESLPQ